MFNLFTSKANGSKKDVAGVSNSVEPSVNFLSSRRKDMAVIYLMPNLQRFCENRLLLMMLFLKHHLSVFLLFVLLTTIKLNGEAQCIGILPYTENFENSNGNWKPGGAASDWAWGTPSKNIINKAGGGQKCWIVGGLTGNAYNENEKSWLQSPCFNFSSLKNPYVSFLVNWDTELNYDGAALQYSTDNGTTWESAGRYGDAPTGCNDNHWYNNNNISLGLQAEGWSGSGGTGSKGWVTAYHSFTNLAGKTSVIFRFVFGAGKIYNNFNGFAMDDFYIGETASEQLSFTYTCTSPDRQASFVAETNGCISPSTMLWDFKDPASGSSNSATGSSAIHRFSGPGSYQVILTGKNNRNETKIATQTILIPGVKTDVYPIVCAGSTGKVFVTVTNATSGLSYAWSNTSPVLTSPEVVLNAGSYVVTVSSANGCSNTDSVTLTQPAPFTHMVQSTPADCNNQNGSISITEQGGNPPYSYAWQGIQNSSASANNLSSGNYSILVSDNKLCNERIDVTLPMTPSTLAHTVETGIPECGINNGFINIRPTGGVPGYSYQWMPDVSAASTASDIAAGKYSIVITDQDKCRDTANVTLTSQPFSIPQTRDTFLCKGQSILFDYSGSFTSYAWNDGSVNPVKFITREGTYTITVTNAGGCTASDTFHVAFGCGDLVFPAAFTPNGDGLNEQFGPSGGLSLVSSYRLLIYNRFGNLVFQSANPYQKWKGEMAGKKIVGTYTYFVTYTYDGERKMKKGTIVLYL